MTGKDNIVVNDEFFFKTETPKNHNFHTAGDHTLDDLHKEESSLGIFQEERSGKSEKN